MNKLFDKFSKRVIELVGSHWGFIIAILIVLIWAIVGPFVQFSDTWQLTINTGTTIITFLMVFVIQQSQNKDTAAIQMKLNELIASNSNASNRLINIEEIDEEELYQLKEYYDELYKTAVKIRGKKGTT